MKQNWVDTCQSFPSKKIFKKSKDEEEHGEWHCQSQKNKKKNQRYSRYFGTSLHNVSLSTSNSNDNGRLNSIGEIDTAIRKNRLVAVTEATVLGDNAANNMVQYNELCSINTCFSSNEVRGDNLGNCSVLNQNIAVICHGGVEFNEDVENGLN